VDTITINRDARLAVRAHPGPLSTLRVFHSESGMHGGFVWERRALNRTKRRFPSRAVWGRAGAAAHGRSLATGGAVVLLQTALFC
jgi:hypothetical protein